VLLFSFERLDIDRVILLARCTRTDKGELKIRKMNGPIAQLARAHP
jgi:hypothetical protein